MKTIKRDLNYYLFCFFFTSILCWILEILYSLIFRHKFVLPGSFYGPYCPIYGATFILILLIFKRKDNPLINGIKIFLSVTISEYLISYITEKKYHKIIWNYKKFPLNINGRVCLPMSLLFTVMGLITLYFLEPHIRKLYLKLDDKIDKFNIVLLVLFIIDVVYTLSIT